MVLSTRQKVKRSKVPKGHNQLLVDIPLDVLIEIFLLLDPLDLLYLARTSKVLRGFLLDRRKAAALWKNVIRNVGNNFPPCPDHMSAPAYVHLAFLPACHGCLCHCETIEWELRMRCCSDCFRKLTIPRYSVNRTRTYLNALHLPVAYDHYKLYHPPRSDSAVFLEVVNVPFSFSRSDWKVVLSRKRPRNVPMEEFLIQQNEYWESIRRHARLCQEWEHEVLKEKAIKLTRVREQRADDIKDRLKELGWTGDLWLPSSEYDFARLPEVRKIEPLTPAEWTEIRPQLVSWARKTGNDLIGNLCKSAFNIIVSDFWRELGNDTSVRIRPRTIDIATLPIVRSVLESDMLESNINLDAIRQNLRQKFARVLPPAVRKWSAAVVEEFEQLAREQLSLPARSKPSSLPSVVFQCKKCARSVKCRSRFTFNDALFHYHLYREKRGDTGKRPDEMSPYDKVLSRCDTHPRNIQVLQIDVTVSRRVENLIKRMGRNPSRITIDELHRSTVKVVCCLCRPEVATKMDFRNALDHCLSTHLTNKETEIWTRASARE